MSAYLGYFLAIDFEFCGRVRLCCVNELFDCDGSEGVFAICLWKSVDPISVLHLNLPWILQDCLDFLLVNHSENRLHLPLLAHHSL